MQLPSLKSADSPLSPLSEYIADAVETSSLLRHLSGIVCRCKGCKPREEIEEESTNALLHDDKYGGPFEKRHRLLYEEHQEDQHPQIKTSKATKTTKQNKREKSIEQQQWEEILIALFNTEAGAFRNTFKLPRIRSDTTSRIDNPHRWHKGEPIAIMVHDSMDASGNLMYPASPLDNHQQQQARPWSYVPTRARRSVTDADIEAGSSLTRSSSICHSGRFVPGAYSAQIRTCLLEQPGYELALEDIYRWFRENTSHDHGALDALEEARQLNPHVVSRHGTIEDITKVHGPAAGAQYKALLENAATIRKGWQCSVRHNLSQNKRFEKVTGKKGHWRLTAAGVISVESTTSYRKDRENKNGSPAKTKRELSESERRKRKEAGAKGGHASANSRRVQDKQKQQTARRSKRTKGQPINYNEELMMTPDTSLDMQLDFGIYPDPYPGQERPMFDMSHFNSMHLDSGESSGTAYTTQSTTPSSFSHVATPPQDKYDAFFHQDYSDLNFPDTTMDSNITPNLGYNHLVSNFSMDYQPATQAHRSDPQSISGRGYDADPSNFTNNFGAHPVPTASHNDMYHPFNLYNANNPYQPSNTMPAFSHTAPFPEDMSGASSGLVAGYLTPPTSSGGTPYTDSARLGRASAGHMRAAGLRNPTAGQQSGRSTDYAPAIPSGLSHASTPVMSQGVTDPQWEMLDSVLDPDLFLAGDLTQGFGDESSVADVMSTAERADHMDYVMRG